MKGNVIQMNTLHLNSVRLNGIGKVQSVSLKGGSTEDPVFPPVEPPVEPTPTYTLSASVTNGMVSAKRNGSAVNLPFTANEGDVIVLEVTPNDGYAFEGWNDGNTDNPRTITMTADVALSAQCVEVVQPPVGNYIQFEDAEVERVLMSKGVSSDGVGITKADAENVTSISTWFKGNTTIQSFDEFRFFTGVTSLIGEPFNGAKALKSIKLPSSIANIGDYAFFKCTSLETIEMHDSITYIGNSAFFYCSALSGDVVLPKLTSVGANGFRTTKITSFYAPLLSVIYAEAFNGCTELKKVYLESVTSIGNYAFFNCKVLEEIVVKTQTPPTLSGSVFGGSTCPIYVPDASVEAYKTATNWNQYADRIHPLSEIEGAIIITQKNVTDADIVAFTEGGGRGEIIYPVSDFSSYIIMLSVAEGSPLKACVHLKRSPNWNDNRRDSGWITAGQSYETDDSADEGRQCPYIGIGCTYAASGKGVPTAEEIKQYLTFQIEMIY